MLHILKLDKLSKECVIIHGDYEQRYSSILREGGYSGEIKYYETRLEGEYPSEVKDGDTVLFGGSKHDAFAQDNFTIELLDYCRRLLANPKVKLIGVCYGHQLIARALGSKVGRSPSWELGVSSLELTAQGSKIFSELSSGDGLQQCHLDQVYEIPCGAVLLASTSICPIQAFEWDDRVICVQGHPEFNSSIVKDCMNRIQVNYPDAVVKAKQTVDLPHKSTLFGYAFARLANKI